MPAGERSPRELQARIFAEATGHPLLIYRDADGAQQITTLSHDRDRLTVGRSDDCDVALSWDRQTSRVHAELERVGTAWVLADLSRNGSLVNGTRISERRRLHHGDMLLFGTTEVEFSDPRQRGGTTALPPTDQNVPAVTVAQKAVLASLCRPLLENPDETLPATNAQIAASLYLSLDAVKGHLRDLYSRFGLADLPPNEKRVRLARTAIDQRIVRRSDLRSR